MKRILPLLFILIPFTIFAQTPYPTGVTNCIARYNFTNGGTFTSLPDVSSNGNNGTVANLTSVNGFRTVPNKAAAFNGTSSYAQVAHANMLTPSAMTLVALVKFNGFYSGNCEMSNILIKGYPHSSTGCYSIASGDNIFDGSCGVYSPSNQQLQSTYGTASYTHTAGNYFQTNKWYFVATSFGTGTVKYYQAAMDTSNYVPSMTPIATMTVTSGSIGTNNMDIGIGRTFNPPFPYWFNGSMDEVIMFNKALSDSEVHNIYHYLWGDIFIAATDTIFCNNKDTFTVNYTIHNPDHFLPGNIFNVELSNATGSFAAPIIIGSIAASASGSIPCTIPGGTPSGTGYKIRVTATNRPMSSNEAIAIKYSTVPYTPTVSISSNPPGPIISKGTSVTFTAVAAYGGPSPSYQWKKNNIPIPGATSSTYIGIAGTDFATNDSISVSLTSTWICSISDAVHSNRIGYNITTGIAAINDLAYFSIHPNPNKGNFTLRGNLQQGKSVSIAIYNTVGQQVYKDNIITAGKGIDHTLQMNNVPDGVYMLQMQSETGNKTIRFSVAR